MSKHVAVAIVHTRLFFANPPMGYCNVQPTKNLSSSYEPLYPALLVTANISAIFEPIELIF